MNLPHGGILWELTTVVICWPLIQAQIHFFFFFCKLEIQWKQWSCVLLFNQFVSYGALLSQSSGLQPPLFIPILSQLSRTDQKASGGIKRSWKKGCWKLWETLIGCWALDFQSVSVSVVENYGSGCRWAIRKRKDGQIDYTNLWFLVYWKVFLISPT